MTLFGRTLWIPVCLALVGAACSSTSSGNDAGPAVVDAGGTPDSGTIEDAGTLDAGTPDSGTPDSGTPDSGTPVDAGTPGPKAVGSACAKDSDCVSGRCDTRSPGGYCTAECNVNTDCPSGSACEQLGNGLTMCVSLCMTTSDCTNGNTCPAEWDVCVPSTTGCTKDSDCPGQQQCDTFAGLCTGGAGGTSAIGGPCEQTDDCITGPAPFCFPAQQDFSNGYCSSECFSNNDCDGNPCVQGVFEGTALCMEACTKNSDCRAQYNCVTMDGQSFCLNACQSDFDCLEAGQTCDTTTGLCTGGSDGGITTCPGVIEIDGGYEFAMDGGSVASGADAGADAGSSTTSKQDAGAPSADAGAAADAGEAVTDAGEVWDGGYPAPFPAPPQVPLQPGGLVLSSPVFVPIFFSNDDTTMVSQIEQFDSQIGSSTYWATIGTEYGIGPATAVDPIIISDVATGTIDDSSIGPWIESEIAAGILPQPTPNTLYVLHYPEAMTITLGGSPSCQSFGGYHTDYQLGTSSDAGTAGVMGEIAIDGGSDAGVADVIAYAVIPRCQPYDGMGTLLQIETSAESHELFEGSTDPYPDYAPAYVQVDNAYAYWTDAFGGSELGDMCEDDPQGYEQFPGLDFTVQRMWSNKSAAEGHAPCVPTLPGEVWFNSPPDQADMIPFEEYGPPINVLGISVTGCESRTVNLDLYSDAPTAGPWTLQVQDMGSLTGGAGGTVQFTLGQSTGQNGDKIPLIIQPLASNPGNLELFFVWSTLQNTQNFYVGVVGQ